MHRRTHQREPNAAATLARVQIGGGQFKGEADPACPIRRLVPVLHPEL